MAFLGIALLTEVLTCRLGRYTFAFTNLLYGQSVAFFLVTWYCLAKAQAQGISSRKMARKRLYAKILHRDGTPKDLDNYIFSLPLVTTS